MKDLAWFASQLVESAGAFRAALLHTEVLSSAQALDAIRKAAGEQRTLQEAPGHVFDGVSAELSAAFAAALQHMIDVTVLFDPGRIAIFADHDEYTTVFSSSPLGDLKNRLKERGVGVVDYRRDPP